MQSFRITLADESDFCNWEAAILHFNAHPPIDDPQIGALPSERWNAIQRVRTILFSVISLLHERTSSPQPACMLRYGQEMEGLERKTQRIC